MNDNSKLIRSRLKESIQTKIEILQDDVIISSIDLLSSAIITAIISGGKLLICGNGGSAADSIHIAGEMVGRFKKERVGFAAIALNADVATMTAIANDYGYEEIFARQVEGIMLSKDILLGISTSGNSTNIFRAFNTAKKIGGKTALLAGKNGGKLKDLSDFSIIVPSNDTARIQESHMVIYHILCEIIENGLSDKNEQGSFF